MGDGASDPLIRMIGKTAEDAYEIIRGPAGTSLRLSILPRGRVTDRVYTLQRLAMRQVGEVFEFIPGSPAASW